MGSTIHHFHHCPKNEGSFRVQENRGQSSREPTSSGQSGEGLNLEGQPEEGVKQNLITKPNRDATNKLKGFVPWCNIKVIKKSWGGWADQEHHCVTRRSQQLGSKNWDQRIVKQMEKSNPDGGG